eukprot:Amastigsp_a859269_10.p2 type:complete len:112 gc:universal Amastigsp_a859269_10:414-79(-)
MNLSRKSGPRQAEPCARSCKRATRQLRQDPEHRCGRRCWPMYGQQRAPGEAPQGRAHCAGGLRLVMDISSGFRGQATLNRRADDPQRARGERALCARVLRDELTASPKLAG